MKEKEFRKMYGKDIADAVLCRQTTIISCSCKVHKCKDGNCNCPNIYVEDEE